MRHTCTLYFDDYNNSSRRKENNSADVGGHLFFNAIHYSDNQQVQALEVASARHHIVREVAVGDGQLPLQRAARIAGADRVDEPVAVRLHTADDLRHRERRRGGGGSSSSSGGVNRGGVSSGIIPRRRSPAPVIILALRRATGPLYAASVPVVTCDISKITY